MDIFSNPRSNIEQLGIGTASIVADLGSGSGFYALAAAKTVGEDGRVYAVDIQKSLLDRLSEQALLENITNLEIILGDVEKEGGSKIADDTVDVVLVCNILFQIEDEDALFKEAVRILRPNGRMLVVDWEDSYFGMGPNPHMIINKDKAQEIIRKNGSFELVSEINAGAHHYGLIYRNNQ